ncbi:MAG: hypothetical protein IPK26_29015 [Planctomycetes bacterium]|nr:hypothetical protein [Planctomycetota bacterium]
MKLPLPFLLYLTSAGLLGAAGWVFYKAWPEIQGAAGTERSKKGQDKATVKVDDGRKANPPSQDWNYARQPQWWQTLKTVNLTGKEPPKDPGNTPPVAPVQAPVVNVTPLEEIIELVSLMYDPVNDGRGGRTHVTLKYKPTANVQAPEWYLRETQVVAAAGAASRPGMDSVPLATQPTQPARPLPSGARPPQPPRGASTPMPMSNVGREYLHRVFVEGDGSVRQGQKLWPPYDNIKLVRVSPDAEVAYFVRELPPPPPPKEGEPAPTPQEPAEERLRKSALGLSQDLLELIDKLQGSNRATEARGVGDVITSGGTAWVDNADGETRQVGTNIHVGRNDERLFREDPERLFSAIQADTYVSRVGSTRGVRLNSVEPAMARRFGVSAGEVIVAVNGEAVATKADAIAVGKRQYNRGTRTFVVKFLSNGQYVERTYVAPERKN